MDVTITDAKIQKRCGITSYKRGLQFVDKNQVEVEHVDSESCVAYVNCTERFKVVIEQSQHAFQTSCTCPALPGIKQSCQHVAAVLLTLKQLQQSKTKQSITDEMMSIFAEPSTNYIQKRHFETRTMIPLQYYLKKEQVGNEGEFLFAIQVDADFEAVENVPQFVQAVYEGENHPLYDPTRHIFSLVDEKIIRELYLLSKISRNQQNPEQLLIDPASWHKVLQLLMQSDALNIQVEQERYYSCQIAKVVPPLHFYFQEYGNDVQLSVKGIQQMHLFLPYEMIFHLGMFYPITHDNGQKYLKLNHLLKSKQSIIISYEKYDQFIQQTVPGFKQIGHVQFSARLQREQLEFPLKAHLYLDRLNGKLLAGVEFHYGKIIIQPLEEATNFSIMRDEEGEQQLLAIIEESGFTKTEGGFYLQNEALEYEFLMHTLPKLQKMMKVYATMAVRLRVLKDTVFPKIRVKTFTEKTNWVEFKFEIEGIKDADIKGVLLAIRMKEKYYRLPNGSIFSLETKEIEEIQRFLAMAPIQADDYETTLNLPVADSLLFLSQFEGSDAFTLEQSFLQLTEALRNPSKLSFELPSQLTVPLRAYQQDGFRWMKLLAQYGFGGVLADEMGLGKTIQSIAFIASEQEQIRLTKQPVLVVCPSSLTYNWLNECEKFAPALRVKIIDGNVKERRKSLVNMNEFDVIVTSYTMLRKDIFHYEQQQFHTIFFDEAQSFKNPLSQTARAVHKLQASHKFALTGTPIENTIEELWSIYRAVFPKLLGGLQAFSELQTKDIARRIRPFMLRRMKHDVLQELPQKEEHVQYSELTNEQKKLYVAFLAQLKHDAFKHIGKDTFKKNKLRILAGITRLRQLCCHPSLFVENYKGESAKFNDLKRLLKEAKASGRRVLIFSQFTQMLQLIANHLAAEQESFFYLDGSTPSEERVELCDRFNAGERDIFLISLKAGGTGLNLASADTVILYDLWWNPAVEAQAMGRAHRMGQQHTVEVIKLISKGTIEEKIHQLQQRKEQLIANVIDENPTRSAVLTEEDIREILTL